MMPIDKMGEVSTLPPGGAPDDEVAALMHDLSRMQTWAVMLTTKGTPGAREAMDLCQRTRCLIVERLYASNNPIPKGQINEG